MEKTLEEAGEEFRAAYTEAHVRRRKQLEIFAKGVGIGAAIGVGIGAVVVGGLLLLNHVMTDEDN